MLQMLTERMLKFSTGRNSVVAVAGSVSGSFLTFFQLLAVLSASMFPAVLRAAACFLYS
jgi:hypothetical protein